MMMANAPGAAVSMRFGLQGPNETICTACAAGTHALVYAARLIAWGLADAVVAGGTEHAGTPTSLASFGNMTALSSTGTSRPFDTDRDGFVMGEGAAAFVLEEWDIAVARNANIVGEILGGGSNADAHHITAPAPGGVGAIACMHLALDDAGLRPTDIRQINAHGTSTPLNDAAEAAAVASVFGNHAVPVVSTKGVTGHALGAAGVLEAAAVLLSFEHRQIPPTANTEGARRRRRHRRRHGRGPRLGAWTHLVEQLRLRRPQRVDHHRPCLTAGPPAVATRQASTTTNINSHSVAVLPSSSARPRPLPARADMRPISHSRMSSSPGPT